MTTTLTSPAVSQQAAVDAALLILERTGLSPDDLTAAPRKRPAVPTFADYVPVASAAVSDGTLKAYGSYWNRVAGQWGTRTSRRHQRSGSSWRTSGPACPAATPAAGAAPPRTSSPRCAACTSTPKTTG